MKNMILAVLLASSLFACGGKKSMPSEVKSTEDYKAAASAAVDQMKSLFDEKDCDKLAANIKSFANDNKAAMESVKKWEKDHPDDKKAVEADMKDKMKDMMPAMMETGMKCKDNAAFKEAFSEMKM